MRGISQRAVPPDARSEPAGLLPSSPHVRGADGCIPNRSPAALLAGDFEQRVSTLSSRSGGLGDKASIAAFLSLSRLQLSCQQRRMLLDVLRSTDADVQLEMTGQDGLLVILETWLRDAVARGDEGALCDVLVVLRGLRIDAVTIRHSDNLRSLVCNGLRCHASTRVQQLASQIRGNWVAVHNGSTYADAVEAAGDKPSAVAATAATTKLAAAGGAAAPGVQHLLAVEKESSGKPAASHTRVRDDDTVLQAAMALAMRTTKPAITRPPKVQPIAIAAIAGAAAPSGARGNPRRFSAPSARAGVSAAISCQVTPPTNNGLKHMTVFHRHPSTAASTPIGVTGIGDKFGGSTNSTRTAPPLRAAAPSAAKVAARAEDEADAGLYMPSNHKDKTGAKLPAPQLFTFNDRAFAGRLEPKVGGGGRTAREKCGSASRIQGPKEAISWYRPPYWLALPAVALGEESTERVALRQAIGGRPPVHYNTEKCKPSSPAEPPPEPEQHAVLPVLIIPQEDLDAPKAYEAEEGEVVDGGDGSAGTAPSQDVVDQMEPHLLRITQYLQDPVEQLGQAGGAVASTVDLGQGNGIAEQGGEYGGGGGGGVKYQKWERAKGKFSTFAEAHNEAATAAAAPPLAKRTSESPVAEVLRIKKPCITSSGASKPHRVSSSASALGAALHAQVALGVGRAGLEATASSLQDGTQQGQATGAGTPGAKYVTKPVLGPCSD